jgi:hypothetical protein
MIRIIIGFALGLACSIGFALGQNVQSPSMSNAVPKTVVGSLTACGAATEGLIYGVTDALTPIALSAVAGSGAVHTLVYCNGTSWIVG